MLKRSSRRRGRSASIAGLSPIALLPPPSLRRPLSPSSQMPLVYLADMSEALANARSRRDDLFRAASPLTQQISANANFWGRGRGATIPLTLSGALIIRRSRRVVAGIFSFGIQF